MALAAELDGACAAIGVRGRLRARPVRVRRTVLQQCLAAGVSPAVLESRLGQRDRDGDRGRTPPRHPRGRRGRDRCGRTQALWPDAAREWVAPGVLKLTLGYGRTAAGRIGNGLGVNAAVLRASASPWITRGATLSRVSADGRLSPAVAGLYALPGEARKLSRDSLNDQRIDGSLPVQGSHGCVDCAVEGVGISEGLMGQMARLEIVPDNLDVVEFGCVFWQPLDGEPVFARLDGFKSELADMDRPVVLDQYDRFYCPSWLRTEQVVELLEVSDEVAAALGLARMHNQLARDMIE